MHADDLEHLIKETGGCGRYQILLVSLIHLAKCGTCFTVLLMVFGSVVPDWWCVQGNDLTDDFSALFTSNMTSYKSCFVPNTTEKCSQFYFDPTVKTVVSNWNLVCDKAWVPSAIASIQMAGMLVGNIVCAQLADLVGRKQPFFFSLLGISLLNLVAAFSTSWLMFAILRFLLGVSVGFFVTTQYSIMSEFTQARWRTVVVAIPSWPLEKALFALVIWLAQDWKYVQIVTACVAAPFVVAAWFLPESFRWYVGHDRIKDAEKVIKRVARINGKPEPDVTKFIAQMLPEDTQDRKYSFLDLFRSRELLKYTLLFSIAWFNLGLSTYAMNFGLPSLSGSLYLNIFITSIIGSPLQVLVMWLQNRFGRKKSAYLFHVICAVGAVVGAVLQRLEQTSSIKSATSICFLIAMIAIDAAWSPVQTVTIETFPTVVRNIGYGLQNMLSRIGAILGPQLVFLDIKVPGLMYGLCAATTFLSIASLVPIPETRGVDLKDKIASSRERAAEVSEIEARGPLKEQTDGVLNGVI